MVIVDDCWSVEPVSRLTNCVDAQSGSHIVVTTRVQGLISDAEEVPLGLLEPEAAARLLLTVAAAKDVLPPYSPQVLKAATACGRLPLALAVAGGILSDQVCTFCLYSARARISVLCRGHASATNERASSSLPPQSVRAPLTHGVLACVRSRCGYC